MNPRLAALLRQRDLLREHATWLDGEIIREQRSPELATVVANPVVTDGSSVVDTAVVASAPLPEPDIKGLHNEVRQGCMMYFLIAAGLLGGLIGFIYWRY